MTSISPVSHGLHAVTSDAARFLMKAAFAGGLPLKVLDGVGHVDRLAIDARLDQCLVEQASGGSDKRMALEVLFIAGLLADHHYAGVSRAFTKNGLRPELVQVTSPARE